MFSVSRFVTSATILGVAGLGAWGLTLLREAPKKKSDEVSAYEVRAVPIERYNGTIDMELTGIVVPYREIIISSQVSGRVIEKAEHFEAGNFVKRGTPLVKIDQTDYELEIVRLQADLDSADASIAEMEVELAGAKELLKIAESDSQVQLADFQRKRQAGGFSQSELDQVRRSVLAAQTTVTNQQNRIALLEKSRDRLQSTKKLKQAQLEQANIQKDRCIVSAPADGVVVTENVELGSFVSIGTQLLVFEDTSRAEISCNLRPDQLDWLWNHTVNATSQSAETSPYRIPEVDVAIFHDTSQGEIQWEGVLERYDGIGVDERTKTVPCVIAVKNPIAPTPTGPKALMRGMFVKLKIELPTEPLKQKNKFFASIPSRSLLAGNVVWMVRNNALVSQQVSVVDRIDSEDADSRAIIIELAGEGIQDDDQVVVSPVGNVPADKELLVLGPDEQRDASGNVTLTSQKNGSSDKSQDQENQGNQGATQPSNQGQGELDQDASTSMNWRPDHNQAHQAITVAC